MQLTSCELFLNEPNDDGRIIVIGVGVSYIDVDSANNLSGTLNDVKMLSSAIQDLSDKVDKNFYWIPLTDKADVTVEKNFATAENITNSIAYLNDNSSGVMPLIIKNPKDFSLGDSFDEYKNSDGLVTSGIELNSNDILIFQYSGHGLVDTGALALISDTSSVNYSPFVLEDLYSLFGDLPCKSLLLIDSCFSGNAIPISDTTISSNDPRIDDNWFVDYFSFLLEDSSDSNSSFKEDKDIFVISATTSDNESAEGSCSSTSSKYVGAFTSSVLGALGWDLQCSDSDSVGTSSQSIPAKKNGKISIDSIYEYITEIDHNTEYYDARIIGGRYDLVLFDF